jgi:hypothetical protein
MEFTLDVDAGAWMHEFGVVGSVRDDVQVYFENLCQTELSDVLHLAAPAKSNVVQLRS